MGWVQMRCELIFLVKNVMIQDVIAKRSSTTTYLNDILSFLMFAMTSNITMCKNKNLLIDYSKSLIITSDEYLTNLGEKAKFKYLAN